MVTRGYSGGGGGGGVRPLGVRPRTERSVSAGQNGMGFLLRELQGTKFQSETCFENDFMQEIFYCSQNFFPRPLELIFHRIFFLAKFGKGKVY